MIRFFLKGMKVAVITAAAGGVVVGLVWLVGSHRMRNVVEYVREAAADNIDGFLPDEVKLKGDMEKLREEYPRRISEMKAMLDDIERQLDEMERDRKLCSEVLTICEQDLGELKPKLAAAGASNGTFALAVEFRGMTFTVSEAMERSRKILDIKEAYGARLAAGTSTAEMLVAERMRMEAELASLGKEYDGFLAEYRSLEREIDLLKHNQKLLELARRRERVERVDSSGWLRSVDEVKRAIAKRRTEQEAAFKAFQVGSPFAEYETRARLKRV